VQSPSSEIDKKRLKSKFSIFEMAENLSGGSVFDGIAHPSEADTPDRVSTPLKNTKHHLRPFIQAVMTFKHGHPFETKASAQRTRRLSAAVVEEGEFAASLTVSTLLRIHPPVLIIIDSLRWYLRSI